MRTVSVSSGPGSKPRQDRQARQQHILEATARCVRRSGFHGASMAEIAAEAKMSVGVIYRYFANKEAIIEAIVADDLSEMRAKFAEFDEIPDGVLLQTLLDTLDVGMDVKYTPDNAALAVEVLAEAARNPRVAAMVVKADAQERELGRSLCRRLTPDSDPADIEARSEVLGMMFDGLMMRIISNPDVDRKKLLIGLKYVLRTLLTLPSIPKE